MQRDDMRFAASFNTLPHDRRDPNPWVALYLDRSIPLDDDAKAALLLSMRSKARQFLLPIMRPLARLAMIFIQLIKTVIPNRFTSSPVLHRLIYWGLKYFVSPEANFIILRHFHIGSEILGFIASNVQGVRLELNPLKPKRLEDILDDMFLKHDLNLFNFVIQLSDQLREQGRNIEPPAQVSYDAITDGPFPLGPFPDRWTNIIDVQTAIELYTPLYQLFLTDNDFWRASNSLQLDETIGIYIARLLGNPNNLALINNKHPMIPLSTLAAGFRLLLHGLSAETLHATLREAKRQQLAASAAATD